MDVCEIFGKENLERREGEKREEGLWLVIDLYNKYILVYIILMSK